MNPTIEERFEYKGYPCVVMFQPMGIRTGYVGIPNGHRLYKTEYNMINVDCHGGLTYSEKSLYGQADENVWWIGFDCGHCFDGYDVEAMKKYYADIPAVQERAARERADPYPYEYRDKQYVMDELIHIVDQIEE